MARPTDQELRDRYNVAWCSEWNRIDPEMKTTVLAGADRDLLHTAALRAVFESASSSVVAEEPEWEYGNEQLMHSHVEVFPASSEAVAKAQAWLWPVRRRRKAGPWVPVGED